MHKLMVGIFGFCSIALAVHTPAQGQAITPGARQAAGLFMQTCVLFAGNKDGLRAFFSEKHVPQMKPEIAQLFLKEGFSGQVYDTSNPSARFAVASHDNATCTVFSDTVDGDQSVAAVEDSLRAYNITFTKVKDEPNGQDARLRYRNYNAELGSRKWMLVLSTSSAKGKMHVIFTASPRD